ncbi:MAG TPA: HEPN domain-containing protein [Solirubrobacterales bacterium]|nr:HEPN domain-containing protein [Solirubrobacterales bacterium]
MRRFARAGFLSKPEGRDLARVLARKAEGDAKAMRRLASDPEIDDEAIGFHAQQAIEKWLKAVMAFRGLEEVRIHDLGRLLELLRDTGAELPPGADRVDELTIYAVPMRYDELLDAESLERHAAVALVGGSGGVGGHPTPLKLGPEIGPRLHRTQPDSLDVIRSNEPDSAL